MASWFKGLAIQAGIMRSDEQEKLDDMIDAYARGGAPHRQTAELIKQALDVSPDLKARTLEAVRDGYLSSYSDAPIQGGGAAFMAGDGAMKVGPGATHAGQLLFNLGHETEHARSTRNVDTNDRLVDDIRRVADTPGPGPRDYTVVVNNFAEWMRGEEGRAHLGGFNAYASYTRRSDGHQPAKLLQEMYEDYPSRMGQFIDKSNGAPPNTYALKPGLTLLDGMLPYTPGNIEAMKGHYADQARVGALDLDYRQYAIGLAVDRIQMVEASRARHDRADRAFLIDPAGVQAHPRQGLPADGMHTAVHVPLVLTGSAPGPVPAAAVTPSTPMPSSHTPSAMPATGAPAPVLPSASAPSLAVSSTPLPDPAVPLAPRPGDPPLFAQALPLVVQLHAGSPLGSPQELRNLAASLAASAQDQGLARIERIVPSEPAGGIIASQGSGDARQNARVDTGAGLAVPEADSLGRLAPAQSVPSHTPSHTVALAPGSGEPAVKPSGL